MKKVFIITALVFITLSGIAQNKSIKTTTLTVKGNCEECKSRIENAADIKGVKIATWDQKKQILTVTYKEDKVSIADIEKAIAASGHDVANVKSSESAYKKLPECCKYRDNACEKK